MLRILAILLSIFALLLPAVECCFPPPSSVIRVEGSSTLYPLSVAVAEEYLAVREDARLAIGFSGTGGGIRRFIKEDIDITDASRPITPAERKAIRREGVDFLELPVAYDGIVVAVNNRNTWCESLTLSELRRIWDQESQNRLTLWSQVRPGWPDKRIFLFGPGTGSGTVHYFSTAVLGGESSIRGDFASSEDDNLTVLSLRNNPLGLGFFGYSYYERNSETLKLVAIDDENPNNGKGPIIPGFGSIMDGTYQPLSRPLFLYVRYGDETGEDLNEFLRFYLCNVSRLAYEVGLVPLQEDLYPLVLERLENGITGSMYEGERSGQYRAVGELMRGGF